MTDYTSGRIFMDPASVTNHLAKALNLDPSRLMIWPSNMTSGPYFRGRYLDDSTRDGSVLKYVSSISADYFGFEVDITVLGEKENVRDNS